MNRLELLRKYMKEQGVDACIIPTADPHLSEYIPDYYKLREYFCGFTGSAGTIVVTEKESALWTDGRYYIQAERELSGTETVLYRASEKNCLKITQYLVERLEKTATVGLDGRLFSKARLEDIISEVAPLKVNTSFDAANIWKKRPGFPMEKAFVLDEKYSGESAADKIARVRKAVNQKNFTHYLVSSPEDIMWLLNIRGNDVSYTPVMLCYALISEAEVILYAYKEKIDNSVAEHLKEHNIKVADYEEIYDALKNLGDDRILAADFKRTNYSLLDNTSCVCIDNEDIIESFKAVKNNTEIENIKKAYIKENIALTKSFYEIFKRSNLTEWDVCNIIEENRRKLDGYISPSFETIAAYGANAAIIHYAPKSGNSTPIKNGGMLLIDTGGQYLDGTTDTTRTLVLGEIPYEQRESLTLVLKGNIRLATTVFPEKSRGCDLDSIARIPLWKKGLDYRYSTGHGIGYLLSVHEGPHRISSASAYELEVNMTVSDEPGVYVENEYGIRIENHLCIRNFSESEYGKFLSFEVLNYCPIGTGGLVPELLDADEKKWLNEYNKKCYELISPYLNEEEKEWLKIYLKEI